MEKKDQMGNECGKNERGTMIQMSDGMDSSRAARNVGGQYMRWEDDLKERMVEHGWQGQQWPTVARSSVQQFLQLMGPAEI